MATRTFRTPDVSVVSSIGSSAPFVIKVTPCSGVSIFLDRPAKPSPLSDTSARIDRSYSNTARYVTKNRSGPATYVFTYNKTKTVVENSYGTNDSYAKALVQMSRSKLGSGDINLGESLSETRETAALVANRLNSIERGAYRAALGDIPGVEEALQMETTRKQRRLLNAPVGQRLASSWLELHYGWGSLAQDAYGALEQLRRTTMTSGQTIRSSAGTRDPGRRSRRNLRLDANGTLPPLAMRATSRATVTNPTLASLNSLGLLNPALLAWNRLPLSFVVDWALPISTILQSFFAGAGTSGVHSSVITERRETTSYVYEPGWGDPAGAGVWLSTFQRIYRDPYVGGALGALTLVRAYAPSQIIMADAVALLAQRFGRVPR